MLHFCLGEIDAAPSATPDDNGHKLVMTSVLVFLVSDLFLSVRLLLKSLGYQAQES